MSEGTVEQSQKRAALATLWPGGTLGRYLALVSLSGIAALGYALANSATLQEAGLLLLLLTIGSGVVQAAPIPLLGTALQGASLSVASALSFAALLVLGPAGAILVNLGSALTYSLYPTRRPPFKAIFNTATLLIAAFAGGLVYLLVGGIVPTYPSFMNILASLAAALTYFLVNAGLVSGAISLSTGRSIREVMGNWQWLALQYASTYAIGFVMALGYLEIGILGIPLLVGPLILPWYSIRLYVTKTKQVADQNEELRRANEALDRINQRLDRRLVELRAVHNIGISLNSAQGLERVLTQILHEAVKLIGADVAAIFLYTPEKLSTAAGQEEAEDEGRQLEIGGHVGMSADYLAQPELALNGSAARALAEQRHLIMDEANLVPDMLSAPAAREGIEAVACLPLVVRGDVVGGLDICFKSSHRYTDEELALLFTLAEQAAVAIFNAQLLEQVHESYLNTIQALAATVDSKDYYTRGHSEAVEQLAVTVGRYLDLDQESLEKLSLAALFHDIGKIAVPDAILHKPAPLTAEEWEIMRQHPVLAERILRHVPFLADLIPIIRHHHERYDGTGYPDGVAISEEPLAAIVSIADAYQAMTSDRPYRKAKSHAEAVQELRSASGTQFVPELVTAFIAAVEPNSKITPVAAYRLDQLRTERGARFRGSAPTTPTQPARRTSSDLSRKDLS